MMVLARRTLLLALLVAAQWWLHQHGTLDGAASWQAVAKKALGAATALSLALLLDGFLRVAFWKGYLTDIMGAKVPRLLPLTVSIIIFGSALFHILQNQFGFSLGGALAASGFVAVILGFALRSVILDLFSGLAISIDRSFVVGDWISVSSRDFDDVVYGRVEEIDWRTTRLRQEDGRTFIMPNSMGGAFTITNHSQPPGPKRLSFPILLPHETPTARAIKLLHGAAMKALEHEALCTEPAPSVIVNDVTRDGNEYVVRFYADIHQISPTVAKATVREAVLTAIAGNSLRIPAAQVELATPRDLDEHARHTIAAAEAIRRTQLFGHVLSAEEAEELASHADHRHLEAGETLIHEGDAGSSLFLLLSGAATVTRKNGGDKAHHLATLSTGDVVGEMSLLTGDHRSASVTAVTALEVLEIGKNALSPLLKRRPQIAEELSRLLAERAAQQDGADKAALASDGARDAAANSLLQRIRNFLML